MITLKCFEPISYTVESTGHGLFEHMEGIPIELSQLVVRHPAFLSAHSWRDFDLRKLSFQVVE